MTPLVAVATPAAPSHAAIAPVVVAQIAITMPVPMLAPPSQVAMTSSGGGFASAIVQALPTAKPGFSSLASDLKMPPVGTAPRFEVLEQVLREWDGGTVAANRVDLLGDVDGIPWLGLELPAATAGLAAPVDGMPEPAPISMDEAGTALSPTGDEDGAKQHGGLLASVFLAGWTVASRQIERCRRTIRPRRHFASLQEIPQRRDR